MGHDTTPGAFPEAEDTRTHSEGHPLSTPHGHIWWLLPATFHIWDEPTLDAGHLASACGGIRTGTAQSPTAEEEQQAAPDYPLDVRHRLLRLPAERATWHLPPRQPRGGPGAGGRLILTDLKRQPDYGHACRYCSPVCASPGHTTTGVKGDGPCHMPDLTGPGDA